VAYVGSSNLSGQVLGEGIEWNYRIIPSENHTGFQAVAEAFERLFSDARTRAIDIGWIRRYEQTRTPPCIQIRIEKSAEFFIGETQQGWGMSPSARPLRKSFLRKPNRLRRHTRSREVLSLLWQRLVRKETKPAW
jgi:hypothetical protein